MKTPLTNCFTKCCLLTQSSNTNTLDSSLCATAPTASPTVMPKSVTTLYIISNNAPKRHNICTESVHTNVLIPPFCVYSHISATSSTTVSTKGTPMGSNTNSCRMMHTT